MGPQDELPAVSVHEGCTPAMKPIPISAAEKVAKQYGYDQVVIYARKVGADPAPNGEHMTTYGVTKEHCSVAARIGATLQKFMGWSI